MDKGREMEIRLSPEVKAALREFTSLGKRIAEGIEKLNDSPVLEVESGPALCPHCQTINPVVIIEDTEGRGHMAELVMECQCCHCSKTFYGRPMNWAIFENRMEIALSLERAEKVNG